MWYYLQVLLQLQVWQSIAAMTANTKSWRVRQKVHLNLTCSGVSTELTWVTITVTLNINRSESDMIWFISSSCRHYSCPKRTLHLVLFLCKRERCPDISLSSGLDKMKGAQVFEVTDFHHTEAKSQLSIYVMKGTVVLGWMCLELHSRIVIRPVFHRLTALVFGCERLCLCF